MKYALIFLFLFFSCNKIETKGSLEKKDIKRIEDLGLLDKNENIYKFYSEFNKKHAGNFFSDKRIATYWIDDRKKDKTKISFAFYKDIKTIDTIYNAGATYSPYMLITKKNRDSFKVSVNGSKKNIRMFFEEALEQWRKNK